jgi:RNA polymerase sigma-70 factor (family 1)
LKNNRSIPDIEDIQRRIAVYEDEAAYKQLFFHFFLKLKSFAVAILKSGEQAEEVVSDVFMEIWERRATLTQIDNLSMYLYVSVRNGALRRLQQTKKTATISLDDLMVDFATPDPDAATNLVTAELSKSIEDAIAQLPPQCKLIFKLAKEDKLKYKEIAAILNISVKTIDSQLAIALKKIASVLHLPVKKNTTG